MLISSLFRDINLSDKIYICIKVLVFGEVNGS
jgi:hypothetical protein